MTDISVTAASVLAGTNAKTKSVTWGTTITAGKVVTEDPATGKWVLTDTDHATAELKIAGGIALTGGGDGQPGWVHLAGRLTLNAVLTAGEPYYASNTAGGICPKADVTAENICLLGLAASTTVLNVDIQNPGVTAS